MYIKIFKYNIILLLILFSGCSVTTQVIGEYHLQSKNYEEGYSYFKKEISLNNTASNHYYFSRFLLAKGNFKESILHLKKAIELNPKKSEYYSWLGVAYGNMKQDINEREAYLKAISLDIKNLQALTYLGHNYFEKGDYIKALKYYKDVIKLSPENQFVLYNRSLALTKLRRVPEAIVSWKEFLSYYPSGLLANKAVKQLNALNDFSYKNNLIGFKTVTLKNITFESLSSKIDSSSDSSLNLLGEILTKYENISIHIISYQLNNKELAKEKAINVKRYLTKYYSKIDENRLKLSWFDKSRVVKVGKKRYTLDEDINFVTYIK